jgi:hypothetical protein
VTIPFHPYADIFPMMTPQEQMGLADDIRAHGLRNKIVMHEGAILDGRNRYQACLMAGVDPAFVEFDDSGADALNFVMSLNMHRRHLTDGERATAAAKLANIRFGDNQHTLGSANLQTHAISQSDAAKRFDVSTRSVASASKVLKEGAPELVAAMERGEVKVSAAADLSKLPVEKQQEIVAEGPEAVKEAAKAIRETPTLVDSWDTVSAKLNAKLEPGAETGDDEGLSDAETESDGDAEADRINAEVAEEDRHSESQKIAEKLRLDQMPRAEAIALSTMIYHRAIKDREHEAARWVWQYRQGVALSYPAPPEGRVKPIKDPKAEAAIRAVAREVNANGRQWTHRVRFDDGGEIVEQKVRPTDLYRALEKTDLMGQNLGRLSVVAFCYWAIVQKAPAAEVGPFFDEIAKGPSHHLQDARGVVANALYRGSSAPLTPNDMAEIILRGWIDYRTGVVKKRKPTGKLPTLDDLAVTPVATDVVAPSIDSDETEQEFDAATAILRMAQAEPEPSEFAKKMAEAENETVGVVEGQPMAQHSAAARAGGTEQPAPIILKKASKKAGAVTRPDPATFAAIAAAALAA